MPVLVAQTGRAWKQGPALAVVPAPRTERAIRIGYARTPTARQELASQLDALRRAECHKIFQEQISTRVKVRPELEKALALAHQFKEAAPETPVIVTVHELKRLARNAAELMTLSADLQAGGIQLEMLTGPLAGVYDDDPLTFALALKAKGVPVPDIAKKLTIKTGKNAGSHPSVASLYRALAEAEAQTEQATGVTLRPKPALIRQAGEPETPQEAALRQRLQDQILQRRAGE